MADLRPLAVVTGAPTRIGYALARRCAENGFDPRSAASRRARVSPDQAARLTGEADFR